MKTSLAKIICVLIGIFASFMLKAQQPQSLNYTFTSEVGNWSTLNNSSSSLKEGTLYCDMADQGSNKYRGDLSYNSSSDANKNVTLNNQKDKYLAIKFIGSRPHGNFKFEMQWDDNGTLTWFNLWSSNNPDGYVRTSGGNVIYYFDLTREARYATGTEASYDIRKMNIIIADATTGAFNYAVDWVATFESIEDIEAYKDYKDDGETDNHEPINPAGVQSVFYSFSQFRGSWSLSNSATLNIAEGNLNCAAMGLSGTKYRADLQYNVMDKADNDVIVNPTKDKIMAVKFIGSCPAGTMKFEMRTSDGTWYNTYSSPTGTIANANDNQIYYFDLSTNSGYNEVTGDITIRRINFVIADVIADAPPAYAVDWIATFGSVEELQAFKNFKDDGANDTDFYQLELSSSKISEQGANSLFDVAVLNLTDTWNTAALNRLQLALGSNSPVISAVDVELIEGTELLLNTSFHADNISYSRTLNTTMEGGGAATLETICLPYETPVPAGTTVKVYTGSNNTDQVTFKPLEGDIMAANTPYIISRTMAAAFEATDVDVALSEPIASDTNNAFTFKGTYANITGNDATDKYISNGTLFAYAESGASIAPYRAYFVKNNPGFAPANLHINDGGSTNINSMEDGNLPEVYATTGGIIVKSEELRFIRVYSVVGSVANEGTFSSGECFIPLSQGAYIVNGQKVIVK